MIVDISAASFSERKPSFSWLLLLGVPVAASISISVPPGCEMGVPFFIPNCACVGCSSRSSNDSIVEQRSNRESDGDVLIVVCRCIYEYEVLFSKMMMHRIMKSVVSTSNFVVWASVKPRAITYEFRRRST